MFESFLLTVTIVMVPPEHLHEFCSAGTGCYKPALNTLYVREIRGIDDRERLLDLGHEIYHAIGYRHE